jgi:Flp pilus assembly protein TadD
VAQGNALCTRCHQASPTESGFEAASGLYDDPSHHHHTPGEPGAMCVDCHMPARTYMKVDPRRDHKLSVPRPDLSLALGTPNACTGCHTERGDGWAAEQVRTLWGGPRSRRDDFATTFHDARRGDPSSLPGLAAFVDDRGASPAVRATAVALAGAFGAPGVAIVERALVDPDPWVRTTAVESTLTWPPGMRVGPVSPLLVDPVRSVRIKAARALAPFEGGGLPPEAQARLAAALRELEASFRVSAGHPGNRLNLAVLAQDRGDARTAEAEYRKALEIDPRFIPARLNLVHLLDAQGRSAEVEQVLHEGLESDPESGEMEYALGLALAQSGRLGEAVKHLEKAASLMPDHARAHYNLGVAQQQLGHAARARRAFEGARRVAPDDVEVLRALAILQAQQGDWAGAGDYVDALLRVDPQDAAGRSLKMRIEQEKAGAGGP